MRPFLRLLALGATMLGFRTDAQSIRPSQLGNVSQMIGPVRVDIAYRRPVARGRELFGALVPWGKVWSPSADTAAVLTISGGSITVNDQQLAAGTYSIWTIPDRESWTIIFSTQYPVHHTRYPADHDVLRVMTKPDSAQHMETLALYFPMVDSDSARLVLHWGKTVVPVAIKAKP